MQITIRVEGPVHVHTDSSEDLRRLEAKVDRGLALMRFILKATVTDPAELERLAQVDEAATAQLAAVVAAATPAATRQ